MCDMPLEGKILIIELFQYQKEELPPLPHPPPPQLEQLEQLEQLLPESELVDAGGR